MSKRPIRKRLEYGLDKVPSGPAGEFGHGRAVGALGYFITATIKGLLPSGTMFGFNVESHSVERMTDHEMHTFIINAYNKDIAEFLSEYRSAPSTINFLSGDEDIVNIELVRERGATSTWRIKVRREIQ